MSLRHSLAGGCSTNSTIRLPVHDVGPDVGPEPFAGLGNSLCAETMLTLCQGLWGLEWVGFWMKLLPVFVLPAKPTRCERPG